MEREMCFLLITATFAAAALTPAASLVPAIYVFGDATVDVGNNNFLPGDQFKANFFPYGIDYPGGKATGRFTNGYIGIDYFSKKVGFPESPPPYLSITNDLQAYRGVNFASGGSGILDSTGQGFSISLNKQISNFEVVSRRKRALIGNLAADIFLSKSLFYFNGGGTDIFSFYSVSGIQDPTQQEQFIGQLTSQLKNQLTTLYNLGARKFLVLGANRLGCSPIQRSNVPSGDCLDYLNNLAQQFNNARKIALNELASNLTGFYYTFVNAFDFFPLILSQPQKYGFTDVSSACCGSATSACSPNSTYCTNRDQYLYWDQFRQSQAFFKLVIQSAFDGTLEVSPISILQLILK